MKRINETIILLGVAIALFVLLTILTGGKLMQGGTLETMAFQLPEFGLLSVAMMIAIVTGGINLSLVATSALSGILAAIVLANMTTFSPIVSIIIAIAVCIVTGIVLGSINGCFIAYLGVPPILATLGTMTLFEGISLNITKGGAISGFPMEFYQIGGGNLLGIPVPFIIFVVIVIFIYFLLERTPWGEKVYMLGSNPKVTIFSGINNKSILLKVYMLSGMLCSIAAVIMISRYNSAKVDYGSSYLLQSVAAVVLGGTSILGGYGKIAGTVIAVFIIQFISTGFNLLGVDRLLTDMFTGIILIVVLTINQISRKSVVKINIKKMRNISTK